METETIPQWADLDEDRCPCRGHGWAEVDEDVWKECPIHFDGQLHPHTKELLLDEPAKLLEEERKSQLVYKIKQARNLVASLQDQLNKTQQEVLALELELINKTPTRKIEAVSLEGLLP